MGTLTIIEYNTAGSEARRDIDIADLQAVTKTTVDASTSSTAESITLTDQTRLVRVIGDEDHRISVLSSDCTEKYDIVGTAKDDFGVRPNTTLYYRTDA